MAAKLFLGWFYYIIIIIKKSTTKNGKFEPDKFVFENVHCRQAIRELGLAVAPC